MVTVLLVNARKRQHEFKAELAWEGSACCSGGLCIGLPGLVHWTRPGEESLVWVETSFRLMLHN